MDRFSDSVRFDPYDKTPEAALEKRRTYLWRLYFNLEGGALNTVCFGTDASVPKQSWHQAVAATVMRRSFLKPVKKRWVAGRILSADAELFAIRHAVVQGTSLPKCDRIYVFTDSLAVARKVVDPSVHAHQAHSLAVCAALEEWLGAKVGRSITFVEVPSQLEWNVHQEAHAFATSLPPVAAGRRPASTLDSVRKRVTESALDSWKQLFRDPDYRGHHFLELQDHKGAVLQPTYAKGGTWLHWLNRDNPLCLGRAGLSLTMHPSVITIADSIYRSPFRAPATGCACRRVSTFSSAARAWRPDGLLST